MRSKKHIFLCLCGILVIVMAGVLLVCASIRKNAYVEPQEGDFALEIVYNKERNTVTAELCNRSNHTYHILAEGDKKIFMDLHIDFDSGSLPTKKHLVLSKITLPRNSAIKQEMSLDQYDLSEDCEIYVEAIFHIENPHTGERQRFDLTSQRIKPGAVGQDG